MPKVQRRKFTAEEDSAILQGYELYKNKWNTWGEILKDPTFKDRLKNRTNVNIKDRHRTLSNSKESANDLRESKETFTFTAEENVPSFPVKPVVDIRESFQHWDKSEIRALAELKKRHDNGKSISFMVKQARVDYAQKLGQKTDQELANLLSALKSSPEFCTEEPFPICIKCRDYTQLSDLDDQDGLVTLPTSDTGKKPTSFMLVCKLCQRVSVFKLRAFFSPRSGCTFDRQVSFLQFLYDAQLTPYFASEMIHMDHNPLYKSKAFSDLKTINSFVAETLQGRCAPIIAQEHTLMSRRHSSTESCSADRKKWLNENRKTLEKRLTPQYLATMFGDDFCLDSFKSSGFFWGVDKLGKRKSFDECKEALESEWQKSLDKADAGNDEQSLMLRWFIKLAHDRAKVVYSNTEKEQLPSDFVKLENLLEKWKVEQPPFP